MNNERPRLTYEVVLYVVLFFLAAWLRLSNLNLMPLSDSEAEHALAVASITPDASPFWQDGEVTTPHNPAYHALTALIFQLSGASEVGARLFPALAGLALVLVPILARRRIGRLTAVILTALITISPVFVTSARTAGGPSLAALGLLIAVSLIFGSETKEELQVRLPWAGAAVGFALASGPSAFLGILSIGLGLLLRILRKGEVRDEMLGFLQGVQLKTSILIVLGMMLVTAGGAGFSLGGLSGLSEALGNWVSGWVTRGTMPGLTVLAIIPFYEPLVLSFAVIGGIFAFVEDDSTLKQALWWALACLLVIGLYPGRQAGDLVWLIAPLSLLAARMLAMLIKRLTQRMEWLEFSGITSILLVLSAFAYQHLIAYARGIGPPFEQTDVNLRLGIVLGVLLMAVVSVVFFGLGWNWSLAMESSGTAALCVLISFSIAATWRLNFVSNVANARELWRPQVTTNGIVALQDTLEAISRAQAGRVESLDVQISAQPTPSLAWTLRGFHLAKYDEGMERFAPSTVIVREGDIVPALGAEYIGQTLKLGERWGWEGFLPPELIRWWIQRQAPIMEERWLLLARADIATLGEAMQSSPEGQP